MRKFFVVGLSLLLSLGLLGMKSSLVGAIDMTPPATPNPGLIGTNEVCLSVSAAGSCQKTLEDVFPDFGTIITTIARVLIVAAAVVFMGIVFSSGYKLVFKADKEKELQSIRQNLMNGLIGLVFVALAWWIVIVLTTLMGVTTTGTSL
jgi:hypothetical protein